MNTKQSLSASETAVIIPAAGQGSRLGRCKSTAKLGGRTFLERIVSVYRQVGLQTLFVVGGSQAQATAEAAAATGVEFIENKRWQRGMQSSLLAGLRAVDSYESKPRAVLLHPVDMPLIRQGTVRRLLEDFDEGRLLLHPTFDGQRGHPPLMSMALQDAFAAYEGPGGAAGFFEQLERRSPEVVGETPMADRFTLLDIDAPADLERAERDLQTMHTPSDDEIEALAGPVYGMHEGVRKHCRAVADLAVRLAEALNAAGHRLDVPLVRAAGLLHDMVRDRPQHGPEAGREFRRLGYDRMAECVADHQDMDVGAAEPISEAELVFLADKCAKGDAYVSIAERFEDKRIRYQASPESVPLLMARKERAEKSQARVEAAVGRPLNRFFTE